MKRRVLVFAMLMLMGCGFAHAQFKSQLGQESNVSENMISSAPSFLFGWFNPEKFHMRHSFDLSYMSGGGYGLSLGTYTNSMMYEVADNLQARADISLSYSPYSSFGPAKNNGELSSIYLSRAQIDYRPWKDVLFKVEYRALPYGSYYYSPFYNPWYRESGF